MGTARQTEVKCWSIDHPAGAPPPQPQTPSCPFFPTLLCSLNSAVHRQAQLLSQTWGTESRLSFNSKRADPHPSYPISIQDERRGRPCRSHLPPSEHLGLQQVGKETEAGGGERGASRKMPARVSLARGVGPVPCLPVTPRDRVLVKTHLVQIQ